MGLAAVFLPTPFAGPAWLGGAGALSWRDTTRRAHDSRWAMRDVAWVVAGVGLGVLLALLRTDPPTSQQALDIRALDVATKVLLVLTAAVAEELFYRGFLLERAALLSGRLWIGGLVSFALFVASHVPGQGVAVALLSTSLGSAALTILYLWRRNLYVCMLLHGLFNAPILLTG